MKRNEEKQLIKNTLFNIKDLLNGNDDYLMIPDYQRGFAWGSEFCTLLDDIDNFRSNISVNNIKQYYLSMITVNECNDDAQKKEENLLGKNLFYIVDGQQRITSLIIIIVTMLQMIEKEDKGFSKIAEYKTMLKMNNNNGVYSFLYSKNRKDESKNFFVNYIFKNNKTYAPKDKYSNYIKNARDRLQDRLDKLDIKEIEAKLVDIVENFVFTVYYIENEKFDVRISFETMNNRGKQLSNLEKLKNRLLYLTQYIDDVNNSNGLKDQINGTWAIIYDNLSHKDEMLSDDDFLKAHYFIYFRVDKESGNKYFTDLMDKEFSFRKDARFRNLDDGKKYNYIKTYLESLEKYSKYFKLVSVCESSDLVISQDEIRWLKRFRRLDTSLYIKSFLMFFINEITDVSKRIEFYKKFEKYIFIKRYINCKGNALLALDTFITCLNHGDDSIEVENAEDSSGNTDDLSKLNKKTMLDGKDVKDYLISFFNKFSDIEKCKNLFYDWDGLRYFLFQYNASLKGDTDDLSWDKLEKTSIEHILPQTPTTVYWKTSFEKYISDKQKLTIITNLMGNFVLLKNASQNSKLSNFSYPIKRGTDLDDIKDVQRFSYVDGTKSQKLLAQASQYKHWTLTQIIERTKELFTVLYDNWLQPFIKKEDFYSIFNSYLENMDLEIEDNDTDLYRKLDAINLDQEKAEAYKNCDRRILLDEEDNRVKKFRRYFALDNYWINASQLRYVPDRFVGRYKQKTEIFDFNYLTTNDEKIRIKYDFKNNTMLCSADQNHPDIQKFMECYDRYLMRAGFQSKGSLKKFNEIF